MAGIGNNAGVTRFSWTVVLAMLGAAVFWIAIAYMMSGSQLYAHYNLAFDLDPSRYIHLLTDPVAAWSSRDAAPEFWVKHPFYLVHRPLAQAFLMLGLSPLWSVLGLSVLFGVLSLLVFDRIMVRLALPGSVRAAGVLLFAVSSTQVASVVIPDAYGAATLGILLAIWMVMCRADEPDGWRVPRFLLPAYLFGVTATNLVFAAMAEFAIQVCTRPLALAVRNLVVWGIIAGAVILVILAITFPSDMLAAAADPVQALKSVLWIGTLEPDKTIPRAGLLTMLETVFAFSFAAPVPTVVMIPAETAALPRIPMHDYRLFDYDLSGLVSLAGWVMLLALGTVRLLGQMGSRKGFAIAMTLAGMLVFNLAFHMYFQYRGSVFLYAGHFFPAVAVLAACGLAQGCHWARSQAFTITLAVLVLALFTAANNFAQMQVIRDGIVAGGY